jgi:hypothetical protein
MRAKIRRLERAMRSTLRLERIELLDGSTAYFDSEKTVWEVFSYFSDSLRADYCREPRPEPPEALKAVSGARDRHDALERVLQGWSFLPVEEDALVNEGRFVPRQLAPSHPPIE